MRHTDVRHDGMAREQRQQVTPLGAARGAREGAAVQQQGIVQDVGAAGPAWAQRAQQERRGRSGRSRTGVGTAGAAGPAWARRVCVRREWTARSELLHQGLSLQAGRATGQGKLYARNRPSGCDEPPLCATERRRRRAWVPPAAMARSTHAPCVDPGRVTDVHRGGAVHSCGTRQPSAP